MTVDPNTNPSNCPVCKGAGVIAKPVEFGDPEWGKRGNIEPCPHPCHVPERAAKLAHISGLNEADLDIRLSDISLSRGNAGMINAAREFIAGGTAAQWLYIWGGYGNAKSVCLMAVVNEINASGRGPAIYVKMTDLVEHMRAAARASKDLANGVEAGMAYIHRFNTYKQTPVLALDELTRVRDTALAEDFVFNFLDERYRGALRRQTSTIFASNTNPAALDGALFDRMRDSRFQIVENTAPSSRPTMHFSDKL